MMSAPLSPIMPSAFALHRLIAARMPAFVGVSNGRPHSWKTPVTNSRTCARSCSSVTGCPRRSKNCWFALSKHRRSSSRTNGGVRSASETLGAVYVSRMGRYPGGPFDDGVILEVGAFDRYSGGTPSPESDPKARELFAAQDLNSHPATFVSRGERCNDGTDRRPRQDSRIQLFLPHIRKADERHRPLPAWRPRSHPRLSSVSRGPGPIGVSGRARRPTWLREARPPRRHEPLHDRPQRRGGRRHSHRASPRAGPSDGIELRRRAGDCDRFEVSAEPAKPDRDGRPRERSPDGPRDEAACASTAPEDPGDDREIRGPRGLPEPQVPRRGRRVLPEACVSPPDMAPRGHIQLRASERARLLHDERTQRIHDHRHDQGLGRDGPTLHDPSPDPGHGGSVRRSHTPRRREHSSGNPGIQARAFREERSLGDVGGTGPLHRSSSRFPGRRPPHLKENRMSIQPLLGERRPRPRIETLADLVFGLSLSIGAIGLIASAPTTQGEINSHIYAFGFTFLVLITAWIIYTTFMSVLPGEVRAITFLNVALLLLVALIPYLLNSVELANPALSPGEASAIGAYASSLFALDLTGIMLILSAFAHVLSIEEKRLVAPELARLFRNGRNRLAILSLATAVSIAPQFWEWTLFGVPTRLYIWYLPLISYWVGRLVRPQSRTYRAPLRQIGFAGEHR